MTADRLAPQVSLDEHSYRQHRLDTRHARPAGRRSLSSAALLRDHLGTSVAPTSADMDALGYGYVVDDGWPEAEPTRRRHRPAPDVAIRPAPRPDLPVDDGTPPRKGRRPVPITDRLGLTLEDVAALVDLWRDGETPDALAGMVGCGYATMRALLSEAA